MTTLESFASALATVCAAPVASAKTGAAAARARSARARDGQPSWTPGAYRSTASRQSSATGRSCGRKSWRRSTSGVRRGVSSSRTDSAERWSWHAASFSEMIDEEVIVQHALRDTSVHVVDARCRRPRSDAQMKQVRSSSNRSRSSRRQLKSGGLRNAGGIQRWMTEKARRNANCSGELFAKLRQTGKIVPVAVSEQDVNEAFEKSKANLPKRPPTVTFRQLVVAAHASEAGKGHCSRQGGIRCSSKCGRAGTSSRSRSASRWIRRRRSLAATWGGTVAVQWCRQFER